MTENINRNINRVVILNNIRSNENVGSIFRTADSAGVSKIFLCGYTPAPIDRFGRENKGLTKASLGAEKFVEWQKVEKLEDAVVNLKSRSGGEIYEVTGSRKNDYSDYVVVAIEQSKNSIDYRLLKSKFADTGSKLALVFGNEVDGLSEEDLKLCDVVLELPMQGKKESLNVAVCAGIVLYSLI